MKQNKEILELIKKNEEVLKNLREKLENKNEENFDLQIEIFRSINKMNDDFKKSFSNKSFVLGCDDRMRGFEFLAIRYVVEAGRQAFCVENSRSKQIEELQNFLKSSILGTALKIFKKLVELDVLDKGFEDQYQYSFLCSSINETDMYQALQINYDNDYVYIDFKFLIFFVLRRAITEGECFIDFYKNDIEKIVTIDFVKEFCKNINKEEYDKLIKGIKDGYYR